MKKISDNKKIILINALAYAIMLGIFFILLMIIGDLLSIRHNWYFIFIVCLTCIAFSIIFTKDTLDEIDLSNNKNKKIIINLLLGFPIITVCFSMPFLIMAWNDLLSDIANLRAEEEREEQLIEETLAIYGLEDTEYTMAQDTPGFLKKMVRDNEDNYLEVYLLEDNNGEYIVYTYSDGVYSQLER